MNEDQENFTPDMLNKIQGNTAMEEKISLYCQYSRCILRGENVNEVDYLLRSLMMSCDGRQHLDILTYLVEISVADKEYLLLFILNHTKSYLLSNGWDDALKNEYNNILLKLFSCLIINGGCYVALLDRCIETLALLAHRSETVLSIEYFISLFDRLESQRYFFVYWKYFVLHSSLSCFTRAWICNFQYELLVAKVNERLLSILSPSSVKSISSSVEIETLYDALSCLIVCFSKEISFFSRVDGRCEPYFSFSQLFNSSCFPSTYFHLIELLDSLQSSYFRSHIVYKDCLLLCHDLVAGILISNVGMAMNIKTESVDSIQCFALCIFAYFRTLFTMWERLLECKYNEILYQVVSSSMFWESASWNRLCDQVQLSQTTDNCSMCSMFVCICEHFVSIVDKYQTFLFQCWIPFDASCMNNFRLYFSEIANHYYEDIFQEDPMLKVFVCLLLFYLFPCKDVSFETLEILSSSTFLKTISVPLNGLSNYSTMITRMYLHQIALPTSLSNSFQDLVSLENHVLGVEPLLSSANEIIDDSVRDFYHYRQESSVIIKTMTKMCHSESQLLLSLLEAVHGNLALLIRSIFSQNTELCIELLGKSESMMYCCLMLVEELEITAVSQSWLKTLYQVLLEYVTGLHFHSSNCSNEQWKGVSSARLLLGKRILDVWICVFDVFSENFDSWSSLISWSDFFDLLFQISNDQMLGFLTYSMLSRAVKVVREVGLPLPHSSMYCSMIWEIWKSQPQHRVFQRRSNELLYLLGVLLGSSVNSEIQHIFSNITQSFVALLEPKETLDVDSASVLLLIKNIEMFYRGFFDCVENCRSKDCLSYDSNIILFRLVKCVLHRWKILASRSVDWMEEASRCCDLFVILCRYWLPATVIMDFLDQLFLVLELSTWIPQSLMSVVEEIVDLISNRDDFCDPIEMDTLMHKIEQICHRIWHLHPLPDQVLLFDLYFLKWCHLLRKVANCSINRNIDTTRLVHLLFRCFIDGFLNGYVNGRCRCFSWSADFQRNILQTIRVLSSHGFVLQADSLSGFMVAQLIVSLVLCIQQQQQQQQQQQSSHSDAVKVERFSIAVLDALKILLVSVIVPGINSVLIYKAQLLAKFDQKWENDLLRILDALEISFSRNGSIRDMLNYCLMKT